MTDFVACKSKQTPLVSVGWRLDRPDRLNAVNPKLAAELPIAVAEAAADDAVRVVVITGRGRGFCAGLDLQEPVPIHTGTLKERLDPYYWVGRWVMSIVGCEKPVIAAINGPAGGPDSGWRWPVTSA